MHILVTGATGFLGSHLVKRLIREGHTVYALVRSTSHVNALQAGGVHLIYNDQAEDAESIKNIFRAYPHIETVYHLASVLTLAKLQYEDYRKINVQVTKNLLEACREFSIKAFVYCSSVGVIGPLPEIPANETSRCTPDSPYGETKYEAECLALKYAQDYHLPITAVRLTWIYGPNDRRTFKFFRMVAKGRFFMIGSGNTRISPIYVDDAVQALMLCAQQIDRTRGDVFIGAGKESVALEALAAQIAKAAQSRLLPIKVPASVAKWAARGCEKVCRWFNVEPPIHKNRLNFFLRDQAFDISKIQQTVGYVPQVDLPEGIQRTVRWYKEQGWF